MKSAVKWIMEYEIHFNLSFAKITQVTLCVLLWSWNEKDLRVLINSFFSQLHCRDEAEEVCIMAVLKKKKRYDIIRGSVKSVVSHMGS